MDRNEMLMQSVEEEEREIRSSPRSTNSTSSWKSFTSNATISSIESDFSMQSALVLIKHQAFDVGRFERWISEVVKEEGNLVSYKGVLNAVGMNAKFVFNGDFYEPFDGKFTENWEKRETRLSRIEFTGRSLNSRQLRKGFLTCVAKPLRFAIGTKVEAYMGEGKYTKGVIIAHWDDGVNPYRIRLEDGNEVWAPVDNPLIVRLQTPPPGTVCSSSGNW